MQSPQQYSLNYLMCEIGLLGVAFAAGRIAVHSPAAWIETQAICGCVALTAACGAAGGLCQRMTLGLIGGSVLAVASIPLCMLMRHV
jgi:hypothetical protein